MSRYNNLFKTLADCNDTRSQLWAIASATLLMARMLDGWIEGDPPVAPAALKKMNQAIVQVEDRDIRELLRSARNAIMNARKRETDMSAMLQPLQDLAARLDRWPERGMAADMRDVIQRAVDSIR